MNTILVFSYVISLLFNQIKAITMLSIKDIRNIPYARLQNVLQIKSLDLFLLLFAKTIVSRICCTSPYANIHMMGIITISI